MTKQMKAAMAAMLMVGTLPMQAQTATTTKHVTAKKKRPVVTKKAPVESAITRELRELREKQAAQQAQIDALTNANAAKDAQLAAAQQSAQSAQTQAQAATAAAQSVNATVQANTDAVQALKTNVTDLQTTNTGLATTISANKTEILQQIESPTTIRYKGVTITPVAFFALEGVYRNRATNSDINTPFNAIPFMGATDAHVSELNFSGRQSRLGGLFEANAGSVRLSGYFESDFLSAGATSNNNQSNSYTLRVRQFWGKAETQSGFAFTGGQTWSLLTENGRSTDVRTEKLPNTIDPGYMVGYTWARQPGIRLQQRVNGPIAGSALTFALALEQAQIINSGTTNAPTNFQFGAPGQGGGLYNAFSGNYTSNIAPDVIVKMAADTKQMHFEVGGVARFFRARVYPAVASPATGVAAAAGAAPYNDTKTGGGVEAGLRYNSKFVDVAGTFMYGQGIGRYGSAQVSDVTVHPNGTLEPIRSSHGMFSLETHPTKQLDVYAYYGGEYAQRTVYATGVAATPFTGYGAINANDTGCQAEVPPSGGGFTGSITPAGSCAGANRYIQEGMIGFTYKVINSPRFGRLQYQATYSYLTRTLWEGVTSGSYGSSSAQFGSPKAINGMVHVGMRYYIP